VIAVGPPVNNAPRLGSARRLSAHFEEGCRPLSRGADTTVVRTDLRVLRARMIRVLALSGLVPALFTGLASSRGEGLAAELLQQGQLVAVGMQAPPSIGFIDSTSRRLAATLELATLRRGEEGSVGRPVGLQLSRDGRRCYLLTHLVGGPFRMALLEIDLGAGAALREVGVDSIRAHNYAVSFWFSEASESVAVRYQYGVAAFDWRTGRRLRTLRSDVRGLLPGTDASSPLLLMPGRIKVWEPGYSKLRSLFLVDSGEPVRACLVSGGGSVCVQTTGEGGEALLEVVGATADANPAAPVSYLPGSELAAAGGTPPVAVLRSDAPAISFCDLRTGRERAFARSAGVASDVLWGWDGTVVVLIPEKRCVQFVELASANVVDAVPLSGTPIAGCITRSPGAEASVSVSVVGSEASPEHVASDAYQLAQHHVSRGELRRALDLLDRAVALAPDHARLFSLRGHLFTRTGHAHNAAADLRRATLLAPDEPEAFARLAWLQVSITALRDGVAASRNARKALTLADTPEHLCLLALALTESGLFREASEVAGRAVAATSGPRTREVQAIVEREGTLLGYMEAPGSLVKCRDLHLRGGKSLGIVCRSVAGGLDITQVLRDSVAAEAGLRPGDCIALIDVSDVTHVRQLHRVRDAIADGKRPLAVLVVERGEQTLRYALLP
jgi:tetratricopeptide (TPR) repeat protein